jgi:hypothetical protein
MVPLMAAIIVAWLGHERLHGRRMIGLAFGFAGVATLVGLDVHVSDWFAVAALMLSALGYAVGPIIINRKLADVPPMGVITGSLILATLLYAPFRRIGVAGESDPRRAHLDRRPRRHLHGDRLPHLLRPHRGHRTGARHGDRLREPAGGDDPGRGLPARALTIGMAIGFPMVIAGSILATTRPGPPVRK